MVAFVNSYSPAAQSNPQYLSCIAAAEQFISSHWTNAITLTLYWDAYDAGATWAASNSWDEYAFPSYAELRSALARNSNNNPDAQAAVATLPASDPSTNHLWAIPEAYARMLGFRITDSTDATITLNTHYSWSYGQDVIGALAHEISEGAMGRIGGLGDYGDSIGGQQHGIWSTMDLFRYSSPGVRDFTDGRDNKTQQQRQR